MLEFNKQYEVLKPSIPEISDNKIEELVKKFLLEQVSNKNDKNYMSVILNSWNFKKEDLTMFLSRLSTSQLSKFDLMKSIIEDWKNEENFEEMMKFNRWHNFWNKEPFLIEEKFKNSPPVERDKWIRIDKIYSFPIEKDRSLFVDWVFFKECKKEEDIDEAESELLGFSQVKLNLDLNVEITWFDQN